jgi:hypothetical protein
VQQFVDNTMPELSVDSRCTIAIKQLEALWDDAEANDAAARVRVCCSAGARVAVCVLS